MGPSSSRKHARATARSYRDSVDSDQLARSSISDTPSESRVNSLERSRYDRQVLDEEDVAGEFLAGRDSKLNHQTGKNSSIRRPRTKSRKNAERGPQRKELMYEAEQGNTARRSSYSSSSASSDDSSERDREKIGSIQAHHHSRQSLAKRICKYGILNVLVAVVFVAIAYGAYRATWEDHHNGPSFLSNGTALFAPTTIVISLDGFRADYLHRGLTPTLLSFIKQGVSPKYMLPSFPSVTFPNHYTMVTGLYPESHGIVGNTFWDPHIKEEFYYTHKSAMHSKWWGGEPIWVTAEKQTVRTAIHMWPGSEAHIAHVEPSFLDKFNGDEDLHVKVNRILQLLDKPGPDKGQTADSQRPQLILSYVPDVDAAGHKFGPNSTEIRDTIASADQMLKELLDGLDHRNLTDVVNVVVVSDHGMATTSIDRTIQLEDIINLKYFEHIEGWPHFGLRPNDPDLLDMLHDHLIKEANDREGFDVYLRDKNMPERYHFSRNDRIAPLWIMPHTGWAIVTADEFNVSEARQRGEEYHPRGIHGYDHEDPLMRAIFVARGPAFSHAPGSQVEVFGNVELYNILCDSLGIQPSINNGTLRLPFQSIGHHSNSEFIPPEPVPDPPTTTRKGNGGDPTDVSAPPGSINLSRPTVNKTTGTRPDLSDPTTWPDWFSDKFDRLKDWVKNLIGSNSETDNKAKDAVHTATQTPSAFQATSQTTPSSTITSPSHQPASSKTR